MKKLYRTTAFIISIAAVISFFGITVYAYPTKTENGITYSSANLKDVNGSFGEYYKVESCSLTLSGIVEIKSEINGIPVVQIAREVFKDKAGITAVVVPNTVAKIEDSAFENCSSLKTVQIMSEKCQIGKRVFKNCLSLENVNIPEKITSISQETFYGCSALNSITLPETLTVVGEEAFSLCSSLNSVTIPKNVISLGKNAFSSCAGIYEFSVDALNTSYKSIDGMLYSYDEKTLIQYPNGRHETSVIIPTGTKTIGNFAFGANTVIESVVIPEGVEAISAYAFCDCTALSEASVPAGVKTIGSMAFGRCTALKNISLPASIEKYEGAFYKSALEAVTLENGIGLIDDKTFEGCDKLAEINIPESVNSIGMGAFDGCASLEGLVIPKSVKKIGDNAFIGCDSLELCVEIGSPAHKYCIDNGIKASIIGDRKIVSLKVKTMPKKTSYYYKESLDTQGLVLFAEYNDFTSGEITSGFTATPEYFDSVGTKKITVSCGNATTDFNVKVSYSWWQQIIRILLLGIFWY